MFSNVQAIFKRLPIGIPLSIFAHNNITTASVHLLEIYFKFYHNPIKCIFPGALIVRVHFVVVFNDFLNYDPLIY